MLSRPEWRPCSAFKPGVNEVLEGFRGRGVTPVLVSVHSFNPIFTDEMHP